MNALINVKIIIVNNKTYYFLQNISIMYLPQIVL